MFIKHCRYGFLSEVAFKRKTKCFEKMLLPERYNISIYEVFEVIICENISIY